jgi:hypothetical protein
MELVSVLRVLAGRPLLVAAGLVTAVLAGCAASGAVFPGVGAPARQTTTAYAQIQIDTPQSLLADLAADASAIGTQTVLLADRLPKREVAAAIARAAGIAPAKLTVLAADSAYPVLVSPLATRGAEAASTPTGAYVLTVTASTQFPVIGVAASGPDGATVKRLAQAPTTVLRSLTAAGAQSPRHELSVKALTPLVVAADDRGGHGGLVGVIVFVALFALWCCALVIAAGIARLWRAMPAAAT